MAGARSALKNASDWKYRLSSQGLPEPCLRSPSWTVNFRLCAFMSAIRLGTPAMVCTLEYGRSPQSPIS